MASAGVGDRTLGQCPTLEARISDLRGDNTAISKFLTKAQVIVWSPYEVSW